MPERKRMLVFLVMPLLLGSFIMEALPSTIGIATGNKTIDGRPLLFKNRDRKDAYPPDVAFYQGSAEEYSFVYQKNFSQTHTRVRMGINEVGFGIVYSNSENLQGAGVGPSGSELSALALKTCVTIQDFRDLLENTNGARDVHSHFGVIDSTGNGSLFEVDGYMYVELPVVDSIATMANVAKYHPSAGPPPSSTTSPDREARATYLLTHGPLHGLDYKYFVQEIIKDFCHTQEDEDNMPVGQYRTNPVLSRYKTATGGVIRGCKAGDDPLIESAMWLTLGEPSLSIALPFFPNVDEVLDFIRPVSSGEGMAGSSDRMRTLVYDYTNGRYSDQWADTYALVGIRSHTFLMQDSIFQSYENALDQWRGMSAAQAQPLMIDWTYEAQWWAKSQFDSLYLVITRIAESSDLGIHSFQLFPNYPNPFNATTIIHFDLPRASAVSLQVFNARGQEVWRWTASRLMAGKHQVKFEGRNPNGVRLPGGVYFYRLTVDGFQQTRKMILLP